MIEYITNKKDIEISDLSEFIYEVDGDFVPALSGRVNIDEWTKKLINFAEIVAARNEKGKIVGLLAYYANDKETHKGYIPYLAVSSTCRNQGIAIQMLQLCFGQSDKAGMKVIGVHTNNPKAKRLYEKTGFTEKESHYLEEYKLVRYYLENSRKGIK